MFFSILCRTKFEKAGMDKAHGLTSSSSSEETVEVEESESSEEFAPEATAKSAARPTHPPPQPPQPPRRSEERRGRSEEPRFGKRGRSPARRADTSRGGAKRPRSPEQGPKGKGKGDKGGENRVQCPFCHQLVSNNIAAMSQHQYWNWTCLRWQRYNAGLNWEESAVAASRQKQRRDDRARRQLGMPVETPEPPKAAPARKSRTVSKPVAVSEKHDKKRKKDKRRKAPVVSPSPEVRRGRGGKKPPPSSSDSEGHGPVKHHPRTLVIKLPKYGK